jgi:transketolase
MEYRDILDLKNTAQRSRENIIKMASHGGCFIGSALSCIDIVTFLYKKFLNISIDSLENPSRDYLFLSKAHAVPALYSTFVEMGWLEESRLFNHLKVDDSIYWHPNQSINGIEFHAGSLGHMLPLAAGVALDIKMKEQNNRVVVIVGDGELNEGSNWEALLVANAKKLDNLLIIVDRNKYQANYKTEELIPLEPLDKKLESFGTVVRTIDGHDFTEINSVLSEIPFQKGCPSVVIANTVRGKGVPSIEDNFETWFLELTQDQVNEKIEELRLNNKQ